MNVEKNIIRELEKNMNWKERILLKVPIVKRMLIENYKIGIKTGYNWNNSMCVKCCEPVEAPIESNE